MLEILSRIINRFPKETVWVFSYGSAIRNQKQKKMIDLIFVVKNAMKWHQQNILLNKSHYSITNSMFGSKFLTYLQNSAAGVFFKTHIPIEDKIVNVDPPDTDIRLKNAYEKNLSSALRCSLLLLPEKFTDQMLFQTITSLSYKGDFRMYFAEDVNKINNIVGKQKSEFKILYKDLITNQFKPYLHANNDLTHFEQDTRDDVIFAHLNQLPSHLAYLLHKEFIRKFRKMYDQEESFSLMAKWPELPVYINKCLRRIVLISSAKQSLKGLFTTGIINSLLYSLRKLGKGIDSQFNVKT
ncbi:phosphatidate cytidylyltransferase, mitochondrial-like isoform X2 [Gordionus sp. m RMFG-2023]|uniref:phosphatidate cytidylyltransferase, mitochondrial-like isoform X2 n=1 Tax=Gordionus sp. m RMFG-2023 TaxID=3053472 RepID=UPI0031FCF0E9